MGQFIITNVKKKFEIINHTDSDIKLQQIIFCHKFKFYLLVVSLQDKDSY